VKLSVPLIIQGSGEFNRTPWHSSLAVGLDGGYGTVHSKSVRETHKLIYKDGRPYYFREKSELWDWEDEEVVFEPQYPNRMIVRPIIGLTGQKVLTAQQTGLLQKLKAVHLGPVVMTGFAA
jgi:hypothetical protein